MEGGQDELKKDDSINTAFLNKLSLSSPRAGLGIVVMKVVILKVGEILIPSWSGRETFELAEVGNNWIEGLVIVKVLKSI